MKIVDLKRYMILMGLDSLDSRLIIGKVYKMSDAEQISEWDRVVDEEEALPLAYRRLGGEPMAYILGEKEFFSLPFFVNESVLIPRPDTETLVEVAIKKAGNYGEPRILDLCTGSGAVGTAIAVTLSVPVSLSDISEKAVETAVLNYRMNTGKNPDAKVGNLFEPWVGSSFDIIVSNPPYLTKSQYMSAQREVRREPEIALLGGGEEGLEIISKIIESAPDYLNDGALLALECDYRQTQTVLKKLSDRGFTECEIFKDLSGLDRVVCARYDRMNHGR